MNCRNLCVRIYTHNIVPVAWVRMLQLHAQKLGMVLLEWLDLGASGKGG